MKSFNFLIKAYLTVGFVCFQVLGNFAQDQRISDSLKKIYLEDELLGLEKLELLQKLSFNEITDLPLSLNYASELIDLSNIEKNYEYLSKGYILKGNINRILGNLDIALEDYFKSLKAATKAQYYYSEGVAYMSIADVYSEMGNSNNAEIYYKKAILLLRKTDDTISLATALINAGDEAFNIKKYDLALQYFEESGLLFKKSDYLIGSAYNKGNMGMVYAEQGNNNLAEENINEAIKILEELEDYSPIAEYLTYMSDIYKKKGDFPTALGYTNRSLELAKKYGLKKQISESNLQLSELYEQAGDLTASYKHYKEHILYRDSVRNIETVQQMADQRTNFEVSQKQTEVDLAEQREKNQRNMTIGTAIALLLIGIMAIGLYRRNNFIRKTKQIIEEERDRSDRLLLNILPEETAEELKNYGTVKAKKYEATTVLFTDFKGFTSYSEKLSPEALVKTVGFYFSKFDAIMEKYGLEKIKTIGDAYMCAGGLNDNEKDHAYRMVLAALEIVAFVEETKNDVTASELTFDIRIGINTGPVVAGVVGTTKFAYDIWGDAVNVASRMESMSEPGRINISENTYTLIKEAADCEYRGEIDVKNRGKLKMYFVKGLKSSVPI
ncbi:MAG: adenylate/guanylate cyclase domain-containing protein [Eudoraea sp.]|uniref:adenylate/guanylate cyclase domain-containing protein n=1 Tax=Eudoraea sp. TaxID=1979955 RepID=UPI003C730F6E